MMRPLKLSVFLLIFLPLSAFAQSTANWVNPKLYSGLQFRPLGPTRGGRATAVASHPNQAGVFYFGATGGGVWKSVDYGQKWSNVSDGFFASPSIGAIAIAPSNPQVLYVGTGSDGLRSNVIAGKGVYRSNDAGKTWVNIGLEKTGHIGSVLIHPTNPDLAYVAAIGQGFGPNPDRGVFKTENGGKSWQKILFLSDSTGFADLEFHPANPKIIYAAAWHTQRLPWTIVSGGKEGGIYKSEDGGATWQKKTKGLPQGLIGKIDFAVSPADPNRVYSLVEAPVGQGGLYRSNDSGETWTLISSKKDLLDRPFYYCNVDVNPKNPDAIYVFATGFWYSGNGGKTWTEKNTPHGDNHDLWISPVDTLVWIQCNDGGANVTRDGGKTWSSIDNQPTAELYQVEVDDQFPFWVYAGQQDNTTIAVPVFPPSDAPFGVNSFWQAVGGCETGPAVPKPGSPYIVYSNCKGCFGVYDRRTGQEKLYYVGAANIYGHQPNELKYRFQRVAPIAVSPHRNNAVYHGSQYLHKTTDDGLTWTTISPDLTAHEPNKQIISGGPITRDITGEEYYSTIYDINESPVKAGVIWVGANDGPIHVTKNGGKTWANVTPSTLPLGGRVDCVAPSPHQAGRAYASILRYQLTDWHPYVYKTEDYGQSWTLLTDGKNGIPVDCPVRVVREDPNQAGLLYAGTEKGLFISFDDGLSWQAFQQNLPLTPVTDLKIVRGNLVLSTMGRGFWILDHLNTLYQLSPQIAQSQHHLFKPADQYRLRYSATPKESTPYYPTPQVLVDYYLADTVRGDLTLEILNSQQQVVKAFTATRALLDTSKNKAGRNMVNQFPNLGFSSALRKTPGLHRFSWDIRYWGSWNKEGITSTKGGPMAAPGSYTVRLKIGGQSYSQSFQLLIDPRLPSNGVSEKDLQAQEKLALQIVDLESNAKQLSEKVIAEKLPFEKALSPDSLSSKTEQLTFLQQLDGELNMATGRYMTPQLLDQIAYLRGMLDQADQAPGKDAYDRLGELKNWYNRLSQRWQEWTGKKGPQKSDD